METDGRTDGFYGLFIAPLSCLSFPSLTDRPTADARTDGGPPKPRVESSLVHPHLPRHSVPSPRSAAEKSLSNDNLGVFCYLGRGPARRVEEEGSSGNSLQSYERVELNLAAALGKSASGLLGQLDPVK